MSCIECTERNGNHHINMYSMCGIQFRSNVITGLGNAIPLHEHDYDHVACVMQGVFEVETEDRSGIRERFIMAAPDMESSRSVGNKTVIPKYCKHRFTLIHARDDAIGEVLCMWGDGWIERGE